MFLSAEPKVQITNIFSEPYNNAVATARTCYSANGIVDVDNVKGTGLEPEKQEKRQSLRDRIASSTYQAGHHTTIQHAHIQFALSNVSRHFLWSYLHAAPYYNSEQQSQRYCAVKPDNVIVPKLSLAAQSIYNEIVHFQMNTYQELTEKLMPLAGHFYYQLFPARRKHNKYEKTIQKKAQEVARYLLPVGTFAHLYHTVSLVTLLRYHHMASQYDVPTETRLVVDKMLEAVRAYDPLLEQLIETPLALEEMPESIWYQETHQQRRNGFIENFDRSLEGRVSKLVDYKVNHEAILAESVREILGLQSEQLDDATAIECVLHPAKNRILHTTLNNTTLSKLSRVMFHVNYTFRKKISHTADSQDQRHRMVPGSRPLLSLHMKDEPDYMTPRLIFQDDAICRLYDGAMERIWDGIVRLRALDVPLEFVSYLLPNAVSVRFTESGDLLNLHHKLKVRLCYNAQEEIWQASLDELQQIMAINPAIGRYLLPPCGIRQLGGTTPFCPEGDRYCGVPVWRLKPQEYSRVI